ncbi:PLD nuclease N-terminal domain-containing protein [Gorillibacterium sp. sgz5001074]|uniref:PLD nuclease N-terminal domain-containing protein n=1 Tax=Gorillibacterium sp. sgz5001074 TaxID=3446695 RepID=UPI003F666F3E
MKDIPWMLIAPIIGLELILMITALTMCAKAERTHGPKWMWVLIIILGNLPGPIAFFLFGRRED